MVDTWPVSVAHGSQYGPDQNGLDAPDFRGLVTLAGSGGCAGHTNKCIIRLVFSARA